MIQNKAVFGVCLALLLGVGGCSRQQSDWEKTRAANTTDSYEQFLKKYPSGEFSAQAQARVKELYEEHDWQTARDADTQEAYQGFVKQYPEGKWTEEARIRVENFTLAQAPSNATPAAAAGVHAQGNAATGSAIGEDGSTGEAPGTREPGRPRTPGTSSRTSAKPPPSEPARPRETVQASGGYGIQLGAFKSSAAAANKRWAHLEKEYPKLLAGLSPTVSPKKGASGTLYRLQGWGVTEKRAHTVCKAMKARSQACVVIRKQA